MGDFAEARRRLIAKIEGCEETHKYMVHKHLHDRGVPLENYYRLNVDVGVGEFGMNEWNRLADISTNTRRYLAQNEVQSQTQDAAHKLGAICRMTIRWNRALNGQPDNRLSWELPLDEIEGPAPAPPAVPGAIELPAEDVSSYLPYLRPNSQLLNPTYHRPSDDDKFVVMADEPYIYETPSSRHSDGIPSPYRRSHEEPRRSGEQVRHDGAVPPPLPPKTPLQGHAKPVLPARPAPTGGVSLPYPESDGPPVVNLARKPELR